MNYYSYKEFEKPTEGYTIMVDKNVSLIISNILYSLIGTLSIPISIYFLNEIYHLKITMGNSIQHLIILFFIIYLYLKEFKFSKGRINKVLHYDNCLKMIIDKIEINIDYIEIEKIEPIDIEKGYVKFKFSEVSQLYKKFKNGKSNKLKIQNGRVNGMIRYKDVLKSK
jgi:hypothetical protein